MCEHTDDVMYEWVICFVMEETVAQRYTIVALYTIICDKNCMMLFFAASVNVKRTKPIGEVTLYSAKAKTNKTEKQVEDC